MLKIIKAQFMPTEIILKMNLYLYPLNLSKNLLQ